MRQGYIFSPDLFNLYCDVILRGFIIGGHNFNIKYADVTVLMAGSEMKLQNLLHGVAEENVKGQNIYC